MSTSKEDTKDSLSPSCQLTFFDCMSSQESQPEERRLSKPLGVEREMKIMYQQPHLVPPMKLTVYDDLPATPGIRPPSAISQLVSQGRNLASRASSRASLSVRKRPVRPRIGNPRLVQDENGVTYRPLQLSIYLPDNRLSDLPEFEGLAFGDDGTLQLPPRALLRTKSEEALGSITRVPSSRRTNSMYGERPPVHTRHTTASSVISTSRPPSEYDALHSHPVSMISLPGIPPQAHHAHSHTNSMAVTILSPIRDEQTPPTSSAILDNIVLDFPVIDNKVGEKHSSLSRSTTAATKSDAAPAPLKFNFRSRASRTNSNSTYHSKHLKNTPSTTSTSTARVSQWVQQRTRDHSSSISSSISTLSTPSLSFSEHRRKKSQFYQCQPYTEEPMPMVIPMPDQQPQVAADLAHLLTEIHTPLRTPGSGRPFTPPKALALFTHKRQDTNSTVASTVDTNIMSLEEDRESDDSASETSLETAAAPVIRDVRDRSMGKGYGAPRGDLKLFPMITVTEVPKVYGSEQCGLIKEIGGPLRSPGVGVAF